ncbi:MAG: hypothetical protein ACREXR_22965, partial [Gammaproteobacteria bacterium]
MSPTGPHNAVSQGYVAVDGGDGGHARVVKRLLLPFGDPQRGLALSFSLHDLGTSTPAPERRLDREGMRHRLNTTCPARRIGYSTRYRKRES